MAKKSKDIIRFFKEKVPKCKDCKYMVDGMCLVHNMKTYREALYCRKFEKLL